MCHIGPELLRVCFYCALCLHGRLTLHLIASLDHPGFLDTFCTRVLGSLPREHFGEISVTAPTITHLRKTPLNSVHRRLGAKMVPFGGWDMPVEYSGIVGEHLATRTAAGLFDVSHMGEIEVRGPRALELVQHVTCNDAEKLADGQAQYSGLMTSSGTFTDDLL